VQVIEKPANAPKIAVKKARAGMRGEERKRCDEKNDSFSAFFFSTSSKYIHERTSREENNHHHPEVPDSMTYQLMGNHEKREKRLT
jgi:hypothetical protein